VIEHTPAQAVVSIVRHDDPDYPTTVTFTMQDAKTAGLAGKGNWNKYPAAMLLARATSAAVRAACPEVLMGISYTPEELGAAVTDEGDVLAVAEATEDPATKVSMGWAKTQILEHFKGDRDAAVRAWTTNFAERTEWTVGEVRSFLATASADQFRGDHDVIGQAPQPDPDDEVVDAVVVEDEPAQPGFTVDESTGEVTYADPDMEPF
jgi:hypothetical protein